MSREKISLYVLWMLSLLLVGRLVWEYAPKKSDGSYVSKEYGDTHHSGQYRGVQSDVGDNVLPTPSNNVMHRAVESFPFDPNEADSFQLLRLGLTPAQVRSIFRHRARGYVYSSKEDFSHVPYLTRGQWTHLEPLIRIGEQYLLLMPSNTNHTAMLHGDDAPNAEKPQVKDSVIASDSLNDTLRVPRVRINDDSFKTLVRHPFLTFEQVKAVKNFQRKYGRIRNMTELLALPGFSVADTIRLAPYIEF